MNIEQGDKNRAFIISYEFNAPKELVFNAFASAEALNEWWGPVESNNSVISLDFKTGGIFHYKMESNGKINYGRFVFGIIEPYDYLEFTNSFSDEKANITKAPFDIPLPLEIFYCFTFKERKGKTTITMTGTPLQSTEEEQEGFRSIREGMTQGFGASFIQLDAYLNKLQSKY